MHIAVLPRSNLFAVGRSLLAAWLLATLMGVHIWLSLSATHTAQIPGARKLTREAQELRDEVAQKMAPEQILEAVQLARE